MSRPLPIASHAPSQAPVGPRLTSQGPLPEVESDPSLLSKEENQRRFHALYRKAQGAAADWDESVYRPLVANMMAYGMAGGIKTAELKRIEVELAGRFALGQFQHAEDFFAFHGTPSGDLIGEPNRHPLVTRSLAYARFGKLPQREIDSALGEIYTAAAQGNRGLSENEFGEILPALIRGLVDSFWHLDPSHWDRGVEQGLGHLGKGLQFYLISE